MNVFIVLPAYNEEECLKQFVPLLLDLPYSLLFVDDCSSDSTLQLLSSYPKIHLVSNEKNLGYSKSLSIGINLAFKYGATHVITLDSDGQHPLSTLTEIVNRFEAGSKCVLTTRRGMKPRISEHLIGLIAQSLWSVSDLYCGMRGFSRSFWSEYFIHNKITPCMEYPFVKALLSGYRPDILPITPLSRLEGKPRFSARFSADLVILRSFFQSLLIS